MPACCFCKQELQQAALSQLASDVNSSYRCPNCNQLLDVYPQAIVEYTVSPRYKLKPYLGSIVNRQWVNLIFAWTAREAKKLGYRAAQEFERCEFTDFRVNRIRYFISKVYTLANQNLLEASIPHVVDEFNYIFVIDQTKSYPFKTIQIGETPSVTADNILAAWDAIDIGMKTLLLRDKNDQECKVSDGFRQWYCVSSNTQTIAEIRVNGNLVTMAEAGSPEAESSEAVLYKYNHPSFWLREAAPAGQIVSWKTNG